MKFFSSSWLTKNVVQAPTYAWEMPKSSYANMLVVTETIIIVIEFAVCLLSVFLFPLHTLANIFSM